jgi:hypothetical protein
LRGGPGGGLDLEAAFEEAVERHEVEHVVAEAPHRALLDRDEHLPGKAAKRASEP